MQPVHTTENAGKRGVKRKHEPRQLDAASRLRTRLHHGLKEVKKATKKVKTFETQKVVKKLKDSRNGGDESNIRNLESQLECLKHIDLDDLAVRSLRTKIKKDALLSRNPDCQEAGSAELAYTPKISDIKSSVQATVESRLLSSKILSTDVANVIQALKLILGASRPDALTAEGDTSILEEEETEEKEKEAKKTPADGNAPPPKRKAQIKDATSESDEESESEESSYNSEAEQNDAAAAEDLESDSTHSSNQIDQSSVSDDSSSDSSRSTTPVKKARHPTAPSRENEGKGKAGDSAFLPSLAVGFISGSSDSDWSDAEAKVADLPAKKNRRGQRARKAIWEKKYGKNANHLKKLRDNDVRDAMRTAYGSRGGRGRGVPRGGIVRGRGRPVSGEALFSSTNETQVDREHDRGDPHRNHDDRRVRGYPVGKSSSNVRSNDHSRGDDKPLHPSWEAKRKLKEKQSPAIMSFTGTRIKFT